MKHHRLSSNALASVIQVVLSTIILFELYRFLTRQLSIEQIGVWSLVMASTTIARLTEFGLGGGAVYFVARDVGAGRPESAARTIFMAALSITSVVGILCVALYPLLFHFMTVVVPGAEMVGIARALLPYALTSLWLSAISNIFLGALDGCQRIDLRAIVMISAAFGQLVAAYLVVPGYGVMGLGVVQLTQSLLTLVTSIFLVVRQLEQPVTAWMQWDRARFRHLVTYGAGLQLAAVGQLLFEPTVKALLAMFGGLTLTGYYELANRIIMRFRSVIVSAYQTLVPFVAAKGGGSNLERDETRRLYFLAYRLLVVVAIPYYALVGASLPIVLTLWLGRFEPQFLVVGLICWLGWHLNTMTVPSYLLYLAVGRLRWTVLAHAAIGAFNVLFAVAGGLLWGGFGVLVGATLALALGSFVTVIAFHHEYAVPLRELFPVQSIKLTLTCSIGTVLLVYVAFAHAGQDFWGQLLVGGVLILGIVAAVLVWRHPDRTDLAHNIHRFHSSIEA